MSIIIAKPDDVPVGKGPIEMKRVYVHTGEPGVNVDCETILLTSPNMAGTLSFGDDGGSAKIQTTTETKDDLEAADSLGDYTNILWFDWPYGIIDTPRQFSMMAMTTAIRVVMINPGTAKLTLKGVCQ